MALVKCSECGKRISDKAGKCPNCGCPVENVGGDTLMGMSTDNTDGHTEVNNSKSIERWKKEDKEKEKSVHKPNMIIDKKRLAIFSSIAVITIVIVACLIYIFGIKRPRDKAYQQYLECVSECNVSIDKYNEAINSYNSVAKQIIEINSEFDSVIKEAQGLIDCGDEPYEGEKVTVLNNTLKDARNQMAATPELLELRKDYVVSEELSNSKKIEIENAMNQMIADTNELSNSINSVQAKEKALVIPDYQDVITVITSNREELEKSYAIQKQIMAPNQDWVITRLGRVSDIANIAPVTEENDPNGNLNKAGGYTATIYFGTSLLGTQELVGNSLIDEGTDAGGAIEVYTCVEDAEKRNDYLGNYDGTIFASGSHRVLGTMVVRTSDDLKASQQTTLENAVVDAMIQLD